MYIDSGRNVDLLAILLQHIKLNLNVKKSFHPPPLQKKKTQHNHRKLTLQLFRKVFSSLIII